MVPSAIQVQFKCNSSAIQVQFKCNSSAIHVQFHNIHHSRLVLKLQYLSIAAMKTRNGSSWASNQPDAQRKKRATAKYKKVDGDKWIIDTSKKGGSVRPSKIGSEERIPFLVIVAGLSL